MSEQPATYPLPHQTRALADFAAGEGAIITAFTGGRKLQERMVALGLFPGQRLTICQNNVFSLVVSLCGSRLALGRGVSQKILATLATNTCPQHKTCQCPVPDIEDLI
jgi:ferrous iron transport protein A